MDSKFYERDFEPTGALELEFMRSPFYELAKSHKMDPKEATDLIDTVGLKLSLMDDPVYEGIIA